MYTKYTFKARGKRKTYVYMYTPVVKPLPRNKLVWLGVYLQFTPTNLFNVN